MPCGGRYENVILQFGEYHLKTHMFAINMGGCDIVLGEEWLHILGPVTMYFKELYLRFTQNSHTDMLKGLQVGSLEIIISHRMEKILNKCHSGVVSQLNSIQVLEQSTLEIHHDLQKNFTKHQQTVETPKGLPPSRGEHDHVIPLILGSEPQMYAPIHVHLHKKMKLKT